MESVNVKDQFVVHHCNGLWSAAYISNHRNNFTRRPRLPVL